MYGVVGPIFRFGIGSNKTAIMNQISNLLGIGSDWSKKTSFKHNKGQRGFTRRRVRRHVKFTRIFGFGREDACCNLYNNSCSTLLSYTTY